MGQEELRNASGFCHFFCSKHMAETARHLPVSILPSLPAKAPTLLELIINVHSLMCKYLHFPQVTLQLGKSYVTQFWPVRYRQIYLGQAPLPNRRKSIMGKASGPFPFFLRGIGMWCLEEQQPSHKHEYKDHPLKKAEEGKWVLDDLAECQR